MSNSLIIFCQPIFSFFFCLVLGTFYLASFSAIQGSQFLWASQVILCPCVYWFIRWDRGDEGEKARGTALWGKKGREQGREGAQKIRGRLALRETAKGGLSDNTCHVSTKRSLKEKKCKKLAMFSSRERTFQNRSIANTRPWSLYQDRMRPWAGVQSKTCQVHMS